MAYWRGLTYNGSLLTYGDHTLAYYPSADMNPYNLRSGSPRRTLTISVTVMCGMCPWRERNTPIGSSMIYSGPMNRMTIHTAI